MTQENFPNKTNTIGGSQSADKNKFLIDHAINNLLNGRIRIFFQVSAPIVWPVV